MTNPNSQYKILWASDLGTQSGFGRIANETTKRLHARGWQIAGLSFSWAAYPPINLPFYVWGTGGQDVWNRLAAMAADYQPDIVVVCQDFPYAQTAFNATRIDWSKTKLVIITPIDGTPIHPEWIKTAQLADALMVISRFGVEALRLEGQPANLLHPGVDTNEFYPAEDAAERATLRAKMGIAPDAFVVGSFMMNQGRKAIPEVVELFHEFALDKPNAVLFLDMEKASPAGWDLSSLLVQVDPTRRVLREGRTVYYREDALKAGLFGLRERMVLCDVAAQFAHREGFGLPILEAMACKVPSMAIDWCSGPELVGGERGVLVRRLSYMSRGTWGGARDAFPDMPDALNKLNAVYRNPDQLQRFASAGYEWALQQTWDVATDQTEAVLKQVAAALRKERASEPAVSTNPAPGLSDVYGPAHADDHRTSVQQPASPDAVPVQPRADSQPVPDAAFSLGRLQPGLRPDGAAVDAGSDAVKNAA